MRLLERNEKVDNRIIEQHDKVVQLLLNALLLHTRIPRIEGVFGDDHTVAVREELCGRSLPRTTISPADLAVPSVSTE